MSQKTNQGSSEKFACLLLSDITAHRLCQTKFLCLYFRAATNDSSHCQLMLIVLYIYWLVACRSMLQKEQYLQKIFTLGPQTLGPCDGILSEFADITKINQMINKLNNNWRFIYSKILKLLVAALLGRVKHLCDVFWILHVNANRGNLVEVGKFLCST